MSASGNPIYKNTRWKRRLCLVASVSAAGACEACPSCSPRAPPHRCSPRGLCPLGDAGQGLVAFFGCHTWSCHWPLMGTGTQDDLLQRSTPRPRGSVSESENPCPAQSPAPGRQDEWGFLSPAARGLPAHSCLWLRTGDSWFTGPCQGTSPLRLLPTWPGSIQSLEPSHCAHCMAGGRPALLWGRGPAQTPRPLGMLSPGGPWLPPQPSILHIIGAVRPLGRRRPGEHTGRLIRRAGDGRLSCLCGLSRRFSLL